MGTKMATTYATLTLAYLEESLFEIIGKYTAMTKKKNLPNHGIDIWMIVSYSRNTHGETSTNFNQLQNLHFKMKFTMKHSSKELPFLDILK